jgi:uncharacterized protein YbaR (Trm112 family)
LLETDTMAFDPELITILRCPKCKGEVELREDISGFACQRCKLLYPIVDEIPVFLIDEAKPLES